MVELNRKLTLNIGGAKLEADFPVATEEELVAAGIDTTLDGRLMTFAYLRYQLSAKPMATSLCLSLVADLGLSADMERRCRALIHALGRGENGVRLNLAGLLNREEDALKSRLKGNLLRSKSSALPSWLQGRMPNANPKTFSANQTRKTDGHRS